MAKPAAPTEVGNLALDFSADPTSPTPQVSNKAAVIRRDPSTFWPVGWEGVATHRAGDAPNQPGGFGAGTGDPVILIAGSDGTVVRAIRVTSGGKVEIDTTQLPAALVGGRLSVDVGASVLPTGAATEATLAGVKTGTDKIPATPAQEHVGQTSPHAARLTDGTTFYKGTTPLDTQPVSAASLPLPTGAASETTLAGVKTGTDKIPASPAQEHTLAASPHAVRLSDGASFFKPTTPLDTQPISAASLPLPTGAATEATLATRLSKADFEARINTQGQKTMASSTPVVIASDQTWIAKDRTLATDPHSVRLTDGTNFLLSQKAMTGSIPVVIASDQSAVSVSFSDAPVKDAGPNFTSIEKYAEISAIGPTTVWDPAAGKRVVLTDIIISISGTANNVTLKHGTTTFLKFYGDVRGGLTHQFRAPPATALDENITVTCETAATISISLFGYEV